MIAVTELGLGVIIYYFSCRLRLECITGEGALH